MGKRERALGGDVVAWQAALEVRGNRRREIAKEHTVVEGQVVKTTTNTK